jgi:hypothetical protein
MARRYTGRRLFAATAAALALGSLALAAAPAYAAPATRAAPAAPAPITVNTLNWSGSARFASRHPAWYADRSGVIHLQGAVRQTSNSGAGADVIGTLPARARPKADMYTIVHTLDGTYADLVIAPGGAIDVIGPRSPAVQDYGFLSLEGITYRPTGSTSPIPINKFNWSGSARFGSRHPGWYQDRSGVIHLQGAVRQTSNLGPGASVIGTLPAKARPKANVFTIVHTFNGTYADLEVATSGRIILTAPPSPLVQDYTFVSLEGITYRAAGRATAIFLNTNQWTGTTSFGTRTPAWYADKSGIIHLQGAVRQINTVDSVTRHRQPAARGPAHGRRLHHRPNLRRHLRRPGHLHQRRHQRDRSPPTRRPGRGLRLPGRHHLPALARQGHRWPSGAARAAPEVHRCCCPASGARRGGARGAATRIAGGQIACCGRPAMGPS